MSFFVYFFLFLLLLLPFLLEGAYNFSHKRCEKDLEELKNKKD